MSARARMTTVALLEDVVDPLQASILFNWLSEQCYMNVGARGLSPHDLVRDVIDEDCGGGIRKALGSWMAHLTAVFQGNSAMAGTTLIPPWNCNSSNATPPS